MDKRVLVLGLGRSGLAAANLLCDQGARVVVLDEGSHAGLERSAVALRTRGVEVHLSTSHLHDFAFDQVVVSPGIAPKQPLFESLRVHQIPIVGELELGFQNCPCPVIGITGTNGKTTTTQLVEAVLQAGGRRTLAAGNIGYPLCDAIRRTETFDMFSVEVSSFQLESIRTFRPKISIFLNLTPDHGDRYDSPAEYARAKARIFENQTAEDFAIINAATMSQLDELGISIKAKTILFSDGAKPVGFSFGEGAIWAQGKPILTLAETNLRGPHNAQNLMAALAVAQILGIPWSEACPALCSYRPLPHRCEFVATRNGVDYLNDSKATNPDAVIQALRGMTRPVVLIAGGKDKGFSFDSIRPHLRSRVRTAILIGETAEKLEQSWGSVVPCQRAGSLEEAVSQAQAVAKTGDCVMLSPACSSFDMFTDFKDRGEQFKRIVHRVSGQQPFASANHPTQGKDS